MHSCAVLHGMFPFPNRLVVRGFETFPLRVCNFLEPHVRDPLSPVAQFLGSAYLRDYDWARARAPFSLVGNRSRGPPEAPHYQSGSGVPAFRRKIRLTPSGPAPPIT